MTWTVYSFKIKDKAYREVRPLHMELVREKVTVHVSGMLWWKVRREEYTGFWSIVFKYDRGPGTIRATDTVRFQKEDEARFWYQQTFESVFLSQRKIIEPGPSKPSKPDKTKKPHLRLL